MSPRQASFALLSVIMGLVLGCGKAAPKPKPSGSEASTPQRKDNLAVAEADAGPAGTCEVALQECPLAPALAFKVFLDSDGTSPETCSTELAKAYSDRCGSFQGKKTLVTYREPGRPDVTSQYIAPLRPIGTWATSPATAVFQFNADGTFSYSSYTPQWGNPQARGRFTYSIAGGTLTLNFTITHKNFAHPYVAAPSVGFSIVAPNTIEFGSLCPRYLFNNDVYLAFPDSCAPSTYRRIR